LKKNGLPLTDSIKIIENVFTSLKKSPGPVAAVALKKLEDVTEKNLGYKFLPELARIFRGEDVPEHETKMEEINYKFAPITSCKVERSFSKYKSILVDNRQCFRIENLEQYIVCNVNTSIQGGNFNWNKIHNLEIGNFCKKSRNRSIFIFPCPHFEVYGFCISAPIEFINVIGERLITESGDSKSKKFLFERISLAIQRGNAASIRGTF
jgi:hypothetical protein